MKYPTNRVESVSRRNPLRSRFAKLLLDAGQVPGDRAIAEQLEPRVMLDHSVFNPNGTGFGAFAPSADLARNDRVVIDLNHPAAGAVQNDTISLPAGRNLNGVLYLRLGSGTGLAAGDQFDIATSANNMIGGNFVAIEGLEGTAALDFVAIQGPQKLSIIATTLPTSDFTIVANSQSEADALINFYKGLTSSASATGRIDAPGLEIKGILTFGLGAPSEVTIQVSDGAAASDKGRVTLQTAGGTSLISVFGVSPTLPTVRPSFVIHDRAAATDPGLTSTTQFVIAGYSFGGLDTILTPADRNFGIGPLTFNGVAPILSGVTFVNQTLSADVGLRINSMELKFKRSQTSTSQDPSSDNPQTDPSDPMTKIEATAGPSAGLTDFMGTYAARLSHTVPADPLNASSNAVTAGSGGFTISAGGFDLDIPNVITAHAEALTITYNADGDRTQTLFSVDNLVISLPRLHLTGSATRTSSSPGLVIRGNGFTFGDLTIAVATDGDADTANPDAGFIRVSPFLQIKNPSVTISDLSMTIDDMGNISSANLGGVAFTLEEIKLGTATSGFQASATGLTIALTFENNVPSKFDVMAATVTGSVGSFVAISGTGIHLTLPAAADDVMLGVDSISATLTLGGSFFHDSGSAMSFTGSAGNFDIMGNGSFVPRSGFFVSFALDVSNIAGLFSRSGGSGAGKAIPADATGQSSSGFSAAVALEWADFNAHPSSFILTIDASLAFTVGPLDAEIAVRGLAIDSDKIAAGEFPIVGFQSITGSVSGMLGGVDFNGLIIVGLVQFDSSNQPITTTDYSEVDHSILYFGGRADVTLKNGWGVKLMLGFSEHGFLQAYVRADVDIPIGPTGLAITGFRGGVTFNATQLPSINDPVSLRAPIFNPPDRLTDEQWEQSLRKLVINQAHGVESQVFEVDASSVPVSENWTTTLDNQVDPGLYLPLGLRTEFLNAGIVITNAPNVGSIVRLVPGQKWLLSSGSEYIIEKDSTGNFTATKINFSIDAAAIADLPANGSSAPLPASVIDAFAYHRIAIGSGATVEGTDVDVWTITDGDLTYTLTTTGIASGATQVLVVEGGEEPMDMASSASLMRIDAGFSLSSTGGRNVWRLDADAIVIFDIGAQGSTETLADAQHRWLTSVRFVLIGALSVGPEANPTLKIDAKAYISFENLPTDVKIFFLTDMFKAPNPADIASSTPAPAVPFFSAFGDVTLTLPTAANGNAFGIRLAGSRTEGLAVFNAAGLVTPNTGTLPRALSDQRIYLGKPSTAGGTDVGFIDLSFANSQLTFGFDLRLSAEGLITAADIAHARGAFVMDFTTVHIGSISVLLPSNLYGAADFAADTSAITPLTLAGIHGTLNAKIKLNTSDTDQTVILGQGASSESVTIKRRSFAIFADATLAFDPPVAGALFHPTITGAFGIEAGQDDGVAIFIVGTMPVPIPGAVAIGLTADVIGLLKIMPNGHVAARLELGMQNNGPELKYFSIGAALQLYINSTQTEVSYTMPRDIAGRLGMTLPASLADRLVWSGAGDASIVVPANAPLITYSTDGATDPTPGAYLVIQGFGHILVLTPGTTSPFLDISGSARLALQVDTSTLATQFMFELHGSVELAGFAGISIDAGVLIATTFDTSGPIPLISSVNMAGLLEMSAHRDIGPVLGLSGTGSLRINTFGVPKSFGSITLDPNSVSIFLSADLTVGGIFKLHGDFTFINNAQKLSISGNASLDLYVAQVNVSITAEMYKSIIVGGVETNHPGLVLNVAINMNVDFLHVFVLSGNGRLKLSTRDIATTVTTAPAGQQNVPARIDASTPYINIHLDASLNFLSIVTVSGFVDFETLNDTDWQSAWGPSLQRHWKISGAFTAAAGVSFLGGAEARIGNARMLNGNLSNLPAVFYDTGEFNIDASLKVQVGPNEFNVNGRAYAYASYLRNASGVKVLNFGGGASLGISVDVDLGEIDLGLLGTIDLGSITFSFDAVSVSFDYNGNTGEVSITPTVIGISHTFHLGYFKLPAAATQRPIVINLAGPQSYTPRPASDGPEGVYDETTAWTGGVLYLNAGTRAGYRNINGSVINEDFIIEPDGPYDAVNHRQNLKITAFGQTQTRANVTSIEALMGNGNDSVIVRPGVMIPINIQGNEGNDKVTYQSTGVVTILGGEGNDRITAAGAAGSSIDGGGGDDVITWLSGNSAAVTVVGGTGNDLFIAAFTDLADRVRLSKVGTEQVRLSKLNAAGAVLEYVSVTSGFESMRVNLGRGADEMQVEDFDANGLAIYLDISRYQSGTHTVTTSDGGTGQAPDYSNDADADRVIISGRSVADTFTLSTPADTGDLDGDSNTTERLVSGARTILAGSPPVVTNVYTLLILNAAQASGDNVQINALDGDDTINATAVSSQAAIFTLVGGAGADTIDGSDFADTIYGDNTDGTGNGMDILRGRGGDDSIFAGAGNDTIDGGSGNDAIDSGLGDDTVTGGTGTDTYADAGGTNTFIEIRNRDLFISDNSFIVGAIAAGSVDGFGDQFSVADEVENLNNLFRIARLTGGAGANTFVVGDVSGAVSVPGNTSRPVSQQFSGHIILDGLGGADRYIVTIFGTSGALIDVLDTGAAGDGSDILRVFGSDLAARTDNMLVRGNFVAALADSDANGSLDTFDRVNYNNALEGGLTIRTLGGDDRFFVDNTTIQTTLEGGDGRDFFQFGQIFGTDRVSPAVAVGDEIPTVQILLGTPSGGTVVARLSSGPSSNLTALGGEGDDSFIVFHTVSAIALRGENGNDTFSVRAFEQVGGGGSTQGNTTVAGDAGNDAIEFVSNAPITIEGGDGIDTVRMLGTFRGDQYIVDFDQISGPGLNISYSTVEILEINSGDGNDEVFVRSTPANLRTIVYGGAGSDHLYVGEAVPGGSVTPRTLAGINGPVFLDGGPGQPGAFGLSIAVILPTETDGALPPGAGGMSDHELPGDVDIVDIVSTEETRDLSGAMGPRIWPDGSNMISVITLSGLGMAGDLVQAGQTIPGGISMRRLEVVDARLGSGQETLAVSGVLPLAITLLAGNGGADTFNITAPSTQGAMLVIYGDSRPGQAMSGVPGNDRVDARTSSLAATIDSGPGNDVVLAGSGADRVAGGAGSDVLGGGAGDDVIIGDSRLIVDRLTRITTIITSGLADSDQAGSDTINPGSGFNIVFGDHGLVAKDFGSAGTFGESGVFTSAVTVRPTIGAADTISALSSANPEFAGQPANANGTDLIFGGAGGDTINSGDGSDWVIGDHGSAQIGEATSVIPAGANYGPFVRIAAPKLGGGVLGPTPEGLVDQGVQSHQVLVTSTDPTLGDNDQINSGAGDDLVIGGVGSDAIDAGDGDDVVFGDAGRFDPFGPVAQRFVSLFGNQSGAGAADRILAGDGNDIVMGQQGADAIFGQQGDDDLIGGHNVAGGLDAADTIDGGAGDDVLLGDNGTIVRTPGARSPRMVTPNGATLPGQTVHSAYNSNFDPSVTAPAPTAPGAVWVRTVGQLDASPSTSSTLFGGDFLAGAAGNDLILAGNGNDQVRGDGRIVDGASPSLASSTDPTTDGDDYIEGNSGADTLYGDLGQDDIVGGGSSLFGLTSADRADETDTIFGGSGTQAAPGSVGDTSAIGAARDADVIAGDNADILRLVNADGSPLYYNYDAGAVQRILPRVVRLLDYTADGLAKGDIGAADTIHGESGADTIYGMTGDDTLYGDGQNDDLVGGSGDDWIYGGTGNDGVLGDDGRLLTSRNGTAEPIFGLDAQSQQSASTGDQIFTQTVFTAGELLKTARLQAPASGGADVIFGGLGDDALHGGGGQDAISGAEALAAFASPPAARPTLIFNVGLRRFTLFNPGFALQKLPGFFLNFEAGPVGAHIDDGADNIFGGDGNDWLVGGTNSDRIFGGLGDDVLNGDDQLDTANTNNSIPDINADASPDILFGGAGLDRMIGNTVNDRLIDWNGEFNQYITPFVAASPTITKIPNDFLVSGLRLLGSGSGMDSRLTEPHGELGLLLNTDPTWLDEYGRALI